MALTLGNNMNLIGRKRRDGGRRWITVYTGRQIVRDQMDFYIVNDIQRAVADMPSIDIEVAVRMNESTRRFTTKILTRQGYLNAILIESRGSRTEVCTQYANNLNRGPFANCTRVQGRFFGACSNCEWRSHRRRCSLYDRTELPTPTVPQLPPAPYSQAGPLVIVIDDDEDEA